MRSVPRKSVERFEAEIELWSCHHLGVDGPTSLRYHLPSKQQTLSKMHWRTGDTPKSGTLTPRYEALEPCSSVTLIQHTGPHKSQVVQHGSVNCGLTNRPT